jgi:hypothetical protein
MPYRLPKSYGMLKVTIQVTIAILAKNDGPVKRKSP